MQPLPLLLLPLLATPQGLPAGPLPPQAQRVFSYYQLRVEDWQPQLAVTLTGLQGNDADLYLRFGAPPTQQDWDFRAATPGTSNESLRVNGASTPPLRTGTWYIGVLHGPATSYNISYLPETIPSLHTGMGATVYTDLNGVAGTAFRVWAPFATAVQLAGDFNGWSATASPLASEGNGNWSLDVRNLGHGAHYRFVIDGPSGTLWKNDPHARKLTNSVGDSVVIDPDRFDWGTGSGYSTPAWNEMVIYELHVGTFNDSPGGSPGTFASATQKLDYLADLGVNVINMMPICEFPNDYSWGYNYSHPFSIESAYGNVADLKTFIREAHARGIAVLVDVVYNHWGPNDLDLWRFDGWYQGNYGGIYFFQDSRSQTPWGDTRPDYGRNEVRQYIRDNALFWLQEYRFDGLRWDSTVNIRTRDNGFGGDIPEGWSLMQWVNDEIDRLQGWKISIAEDMWNNEWITKDTGVGGAGFDSQWDAQFVHPVRAFMIEPDDNNRNMWALRDAIAHYYNGSAFQRVAYTESHDETANGKSRLPEAIWPGNATSWYSKKRSTLGAALVFTSPGIPMILQGQELLEDGWFSDTDPVDWSRLITFAGIHDLYRDLIRLRRNWYNNTRGLLGNNLNVYHVNDTDKVLAFHRWDQGGPGDDVIVLVNCANRSYPVYNIGLPRGGTWYVRFNSDWAGYDPTFGDWPSPDVTAVAGSMHGMPFWGSVSIGPYTAVILSQ